MIAANRIASPSKKVELPESSEHERFEVVFTAYAVARRAAQSPVSRCTSRATRLRIASPCSSWLASTASGSTSSAMASAR
jgi:hypothetical protein